MLRDPLLMLRGPAPASSRQRSFSRPSQYQAQAPLGDLLKQNLVMGLGFGAAVAFVAALFR